MNKRQLHLLGVPCIEWENGDVPRFRSQRTIALLGYLVAERRPLTRASLAALFWPDEPADKGKANLRRELHNLAQILPDCWETDRVQVCFVPSAHTIVDLDALQQYIGTGGWQAAADLVHGEFLEGIDLEENPELETWLLGERERWRQRAESLLTNAIDDDIQQADYIAALDNAHRLLQLTPWHEATHRQVMRLLAWTDQRAAALRQYQLCVDILDTELGVPPEPETTQLYDEIREGNALLPPSATAGPSPPRHNLPAQTTPLIGREEELETLTKMIADPDIRLVTITGIGGMGKTRLALGIAWQLAEGHFHDGVVFVTLATVETGAQVISAVASAMRLPLSGPDSRALRRQLRNFLRRKEVLLILDNCEHLLDELEIVTELLHASPQLCILATSREHLNLYGEHRFALQGLARRDEQIDHPAAQLFTAAARRVNPTFACSDQNASQINRICSLVDGMPLALELAAAVTDSLTPVTIAEQVANSLDILTSNLRDLPNRHRSMHAVLETTWQQIPNTTRQIFAALSVFVGGFTRAAAEAVTGASSQQLSKLVAQSLLNFDPEAERYTLHELLRQFAAGRLEENTQHRQHSRNRHCQYFATLLSDFELAGKVDYRMTAISLLNMQSEQENIKAAWQRARQVPHIEEIGKLAYSMSLFYEFLGLTREGHTAFENAVQRLKEQPGPIDSLALTRTLTHYGYYCQALNELEQARTALDEALFHAATLDDSHIPDIGLLHVFLGWVTHLQGQTPSARQTLATGGELCLAGQFKLGHLISLQMMSELEYDTSNDELALDYCQQALSQYKDSQFHTLLTLGFLAIAHVDLGNDDDAAKHLHQMLDLLRTVPSIQGALLLLVAIGALYAQKGRAELGVEYVALALHHPQMESFIRHKAETVLNELKPRIAVDRFQEIMELATQRRLTKVQIEPDFTMIEESINQIAAILLRACGSSFFDQATVSSTR